MYNTLDRSCEGGEIFISWITKPSASSWATINFETSDAVNFHLPALLFIRELHTSAAIQLLQLIILCIYDYFKIQHTSRLFKNQVTETKKNIVFVSWKFMEFFFGR